VHNSKREIEERKRKEAEKSSRRTVKVAAIQASSDLGDLEGNTRKLTALIQEAARNGAKFMCVSTHVAVHSLVCLQRLA